MKDKITRRRFIKKASLGVAIASITPTTLYNLPNEVAKDDTPFTNELKYRRFFQHPLLPYGEKISEGESQQLLQAIRIFADREKFDDFSALEKFITEYPNSSWNGSLSLNLGCEYFVTGKFSKAISAFERSWNLLKASQEASIIPMADRAFGELIKMASRLGDYKKIESLLKEKGSRIISGSSAEYITAAIEGYWVMKKNPNRAFRCGPNALESIVNYKKMKCQNNNLLTQAQSTKKGINLFDVWKLSEEAEMNLVPVKFDTLPIEIPTPSVVHWKLNHYAAILEKNDDLYRIQDTTFGVDFTAWVSKETIFDECSGNFLIPQNELTNNLIVSTNSEIKKIWGKGITTQPNPDQTGIHAPRGRTDCPSPHGLATFNVIMPNMNLNITDIPLWYTPPRGLPIEHILTYNDREVNPDTEPNYTNFGTNWKYNWITFLQITNGSNFKVFDGQGGNLEYRLDVLQRYNQTRLTKINDATYRLTYPSGMIMEFSRSDNSLSNLKKIFLSKIIDETGKNITEIEYENVKL
jgi:tetratricopeptide (TPR) repeat protein